MHDFPSEMFQMFLEIVTLPTAHHCAEQVNVFELKIWLNS